MNRTEYRYYRVSLPMSVRRFAAVLANFETITESLGDGSSVVHGVPGGAMIEWRPAVEGRK